MTLACSDRKKVSRTTHTVLGSGMNKKKGGGPAHVARDLDEDHFEEIKYETVSHILSEGVKKARNAK